MAGPQILLGPRVRWSGVVGAVNTPGHDDRPPALYLPDPAARGGGVLRAWRWATGRHRPPRHPLPLPLTEIVAGDVQREVGTVKDLWIEGRHILARGTLTLPAADTVNPPWARALRLGLPTSAVIRVDTADPVPAPPDAIAALHGRPVHTDWRITGVVVNTVPCWHDCLIHLAADTAR